MDLAAMINSTFKNGISKLVAVSSSIMGVLRLLKETEIHQKKE